MGERWEEAGGGPAGRASPRRERDGQLEDTQEGWRGGDDGSRVSGPLLSHWLSGSKTLKEEKTGLNLTSAH